MGTDVDDPPDEVPPSLWVMDLPGGRAAATHRGSSTARSASGRGATCCRTERRPGPVWIDDATIGTIVGDRGRDLPYRVTLEGDAGR